MSMLAATEVSVLSAVSQSHLDKPDRFRSTIGALSPTTMIIVPNGNKVVSILHCGSLYSRGLGTEPKSIFIAGNRELLPIKMLDVDEAVLAIGAGNSAATRPRSIDTPLIKSFFGIESNEDFQALKPTDKHQSLKDRPNHLLIHPRVFKLAKVASPWRRASLHGVSSKRSIHFQSYLMPTEMRCPTRRISWSSFYRTFGWSPKDLSKT